MDKSTSNTWKTLWLGIAVILLIVSVFAVRSKRRSDIPDDLIGEWHTTDARYSDRSFEIDAVSLNFGTGDGGVTTGFIKDVRTSAEGARILYKVSYTVDNEVREVSFYFEESEGKIIRFKNQENIAWKKDQSSLPD